MEINEYKYVWTFFSNLCYPKDFAQYLLMWKTIYPQYSVLIEDADEFSAHKFQLYITFIWWKNIFSRVSSKVPTENSGNFSTKLNPKILF